jgi:uncharacterized protein (TIGR02757 family)
VRNRDRWTDVRKRLDGLYARYHRREFVHPDPVEFLYGYGDPRDREVVGLVASSLAYGRVAQILASVSRVLERMPSPASFVAGSSRRTLRREFAGFKHRFTTGDELSGLLLGVKRAVEEHGSLRACFAAGIRPGDETVVPALTNFAGTLSREMGDGCNSILPSPCRGSACKRLNLFLRWMVRRDEVDPGGWDEVPPSSLLVPLDTHMYRVSRALGFTRRRSADLRTALEVTEAFRRIHPGDPVRYDFVLTRAGIWGHGARAGGRKAAKGRREANPDCAAGPFLKGVDADLTRRTRCTQ